MDTRFSVFTKRQHPIYQIVNAPEIIIKQKTFSEGKENSYDPGKLAFSNSHIHDLEGGLEYYGATNFSYGCVSTDKTDFNFSKIEALRKIECRIAI